MKFILENALICDGLGSPVFKGGLIVNNEIIEGVFHGEFNQNTSYKRHNLKGLTICPGFIDIHGHSELQVLKDPQISSKINQGILTELGGNCGAGVFPFLKNKIDHQRGMADILGDYKPWQWSNLKGYLEQYKQKNSPLDIFLLQAHGPLRYSVLDDFTKESNDKELSAMVDLLEESFDQGAMGFSSGLYYSPCCFASKKELLSLCKVSAKHNKLFSVHHRNEGDGVVSSLKEILDIALESGVKTQISHLKAIGNRNQPYVETLLSLIDHYSRLGLDVEFDQYPYLYGSTSLFSLLPPKVLGLSQTDLFSYLANENNYDDLIKEIEGAKDWDSLIPLCGWDKIILNSISQKEYQGLSIQEAAIKAKREPAYFFFKLLSKERGVATMIDYTQSEDSLIQIMKHPKRHFGTDALFSGQVFHPRTYNATFHLFDRYVNDLKILSFEKMVYTMTYKNAKRIGLSDRGILKENCMADLIILDPYKLKDKSTLKNEAVPGEGIKQIYKRGKPLL